MILRTKDSLSGVQSVKRGTSRGTLSMFFRWGRTWWIPRGSLAYKHTGKFYISNRIRKLLKSVAQSLITFLILASKVGEVFLRRVKTRKTLQHAGSGTPGTGYDRAMCTICLLCCSLPESWAHHCLWAESWQDLTGLHPQEVTDLQHHPENLSIQTNKVSVNIDAQVLGLQQSRVYNAHSHSTLLTWYLWTTWANKFVCVRRKNTREFPFPLSVA